MRYNGVDKGNYSRNISSRKKELTERRRKKEIDT